MSSAPPLTITEIEVPGGARLGLMHCPGRCGGAYGERNLQADLAAVEAWGADALVTLIEAKEFDKLSVPDFAREAARRRFRWHHVPVPDFGVPSDETLAAWAGAREHIADLLRRRGRIGLHCAAGLGRTGTFAAKILAEHGVPPAVAVAEVRRLRPGAIETAVQLAFVMDGPRLF